MTLGGAVALSRAYVYDYGPRLCMLSIWGRPRLSGNKGEALAAATVPHFLRYPGGKRRLVDFLEEQMGSEVVKAQRYVEPFVGGASVFLALEPRKAVLGDINGELVDLLRGIRRYPGRVWEHYASFGSTKAAFKAARKLDPKRLDLASRAARTLYLNRTCFKGMWRHNAKGAFNVGYGGQARRWVISERYLRAVATSLRRARLIRGDFEPLIDSCGKGDFLFVDPPYRPGERELVNQHYLSRTFVFADHVRLAEALRRATRRRASWAVTTSGHADIAALYRGLKVCEVPSRRGSGGEVLITAY